MEIRVHFVAAALLVVAVPVHASDGLELAIKGKAMAAAVSAPPVVAIATPTVTHGGKDPLPEILMRAESETHSLGPGCADGAATLCYDLRDGRMVYRGAREYMPHVEGMKAESISLRHDGFVLRYSFK